MEKHKTFISFYHRDDERYKVYIEERFSDFIINKSVQDGEYDKENSDEYVKRLIREDKVSDSSVMIVLVGPNTYKRKHVDWEIYAALRDSVNGNSGLIGVLLPTYELNSNGTYRWRDIPSRLADNVISGYSKIYTWSWFCDHFSSIVQKAFENRILLKDKKNNTRKQMEDNIQ